MSEGLSPTQAGADMLSAANQESTPVAENAPVQQPVTQQPSSPQAGGNTGGGHPAWQEYLADIPEGFRPVVTPAFEKWDKNVQDKLRQVHSEYEPLKAYQNFAENKVAPEQLQQSLQLMQLIERDPEAVYRALQENFGFGGEQGLSEDGDEEYDLGGSGQQQVNDPRISQLEQQQQALIAGMQEAQQAQAQREADQWVDQQIGWVEQQLNSRGIQPNADIMRYILGTAAATGSNDKDNTAAIQSAFESFVNLHDSIRSRPAPQGPTVMPTSGGVPSNAVDVTSMDPKDRRKLGADMLTQMLRE